MAVQTIDQNFGIDGHAKAHRLFREAHITNTAGILNAAEGRDPNDERPAFDPKHDDNQWPLMVHHPQKGELTVGKTLKGVKDEADRARIGRQNKIDLDAALKIGYRREPYPKPQVALLDPAAEKQALLKRNEELAGQVIALTDMMAKVAARLDSVESK